MPVALYMTEAAKHPDADEGAGGREGLAAEHRVVEGRARVLVGPDAGQAAGAERADLLNLPRRHARQAAHRNLVGRPPFLGGGKGHLSSPSGS